MAEPSVRRVLLGADAVGGAWTFAVGLAAGLARAGVRTTLATMGPLPSEAQRREAAAVPGLELEESDARLEWMDEPWDDVARAGEWLLDIERRTRPDVVHLGGYAHAALPFRAPVVVTAHSCVVTWWRAVHGEEPPPAWDRYRRELRRGLDGAGAVVAPTRAMLRALVAAHGPVRDPRVIWHAAPPREGAGGPREPIVLAAGRAWDPAKNLATLDAAASDLPWPVVLAGSDAHPDGTRRPLRHVRTLGWLGPGELAAWMARASIYVAPARYEPFGLGALEAALSGAALVLGDLESLREVWGDAALWVPQDDPRAVGRAIRALIDDAGLRQRLAARARHRALAWSPDRQVAAWVSLYRELAGRALRG
jgi:glycosyltransferase involved in cell wall biosynthesis